MALCGERANCLHSSSLNLQTDCPTTPNAAATMCGLSISSTGGLFSHCGQAPVHRKSCQIRRPALARPGPKTATSLPKPPMDRASSILAPVSHQHRATSRASAIAPATRYVRRFCVYVVEAWLAPGLCIIHLKGTNALMESRRTCTRKLLVLRLLLEAQPVQFDGRVRSQYQPCEAECQQNCRYHSWGP